MADAAHVFLLVAVAAALAGRSDGAWCVCRPELADSALQKALDYACGAGADCKPILQSGACFAPDTVKAHCSYAVNSFYQRNSQNPQACVFSGTATLSNSDPSGNGCTYPATPREARGQVPPKPVPFETLHGGSAIRFLVSVYATAQNIYDMTKEVGQGSGSERMGGAAATTSNSSPGVYSPPTMGPTALNDNSAAASVLPVAGLTTVRLLILASCSLVALCIGA
ncbi:PLASMODESMATA CALLOSE-BINDING PROTEIN 3 isoform X1 [Zea mays]|uniref:Glucan endo-1,3-beta-glucosidase 3 n=1 Tax=Zea mays TaxID=4577 RepID=A0A1D6GGU8_MAIZE|nr:PLASMODESMATA CALLOSE-BINDING PROTEIN 3 isoform X1 [Zea mays]AQK62764.1 Glucan endo-1,3-beta-glucosidase 3 [Zea mays]|eukprot:XP_020393455.1 PLASMODESMATA CALLOSE-BINDING PROTEIN 3 isoform X1 [Zea mays]